MRDTCRQINHYDSCEQSRPETGNPHTHNSSLRLTAAINFKLLPYTRRHRRDECLDIEVYSATQVKTYGVFTPLMFRNHVLKPLKVWPANHLEITQPVNIHRSRRNHQHAL